MWKDIGEVWQAAFLEGWEAFKHGAVHYIEDDPYVKNKNIDAKFELEEMELVQLTMQSYRYYVMNDGSDGVVDQKFALDCPRAVELARAFYKERVLDAYAEQGADFGEVYDRIVRSAK